MAKPLVGKKIHIGNQTRNMRFTMTALRVAQKRYDGKAIRDVIRNLDIDQVCELGAAGFLHEDAKISADTVSRWLDAEPQKFGELAIAIVECITEAYSRMTPDEPSGEAKSEGTAAAPTTDGPTLD